MSIIFRKFYKKKPDVEYWIPIRDLGIRNIYYTTNDGYAHEKLEKYEVGGVA